MNDLELFFRENDRNMGKRIHKWSNYFSVYDRYLSRYRGKNVNILEIGVSQGGSLDMWRSYFQGKAKIYGVDVDERCRRFEREDTMIFIGDQADREFLEELRGNIPKMDIIIDDGGHTMRQQITTFEELYGHVRDDGVYICEDLCTSYYRRYGGGYQKSTSFIEYSKNFIDYINAWFSEKRSKLDVNEFTLTTESIHYHPGIIVIEKGIISEPVELKSGKIQFDSTPSLIRRLKNRVKID